MNILLTKRLSSIDHDLIQSWNWKYEVTEALKIIPVEVNEIPDAAIWVVSSRNSFNAVAKFISQAPEFIFCVGRWTKDQLLQVGAKSKVLSFENMKKLVADLNLQPSQTILYFCGEDHRPELEEGLRNSRIDIFKVLTHRSEMTYPTVAGNFDAVFVFSPRAAASLLKNNTFDDKTIFACIGATTAEFLKSKGIANTFVPSYPDSRILLEEFHHNILNYKS